ncbi:MAG TPA: hypothetical protein VE174_09080 [Actinomycetota bacterium]|nr:hypothetical protein [Actinomycetota bacterium]
MKKHMVKWLALFSTVVLVAAALVGMASAHIGASHSPFTTEAPDLRSVSLDGNDVDFCFDEVIAGPQQLAPGKFGMRGYNSATVAVGDDADIDNEDAKCVQVDFDDARPTEQFTIGVVLTAAVVDDQGKGNVVSSASLSDSKVDNGPGITDAPNLARSFKIDSIEFTLDEGMNCAAMGASAFGYYKDEGTSSTFYGTGVSDCDNDEAVIEFADPVEDIARVFVDPSNGNEPCAKAPATACIGWESEGDDTDDPDLEDAERNGENVTFSFDEDITGDPDEGRFQVAAEDGTKFAPEADSCEIENGDEVTCEFPAIDDAGDGEIVLAGVGECAVDADGDGECSSIGDASMATSGHAPGFSDGPDLESCDVDESDAKATFVFDEPVDAGSAEADKFGVFNGSGDSSGGDGVSSVSGNSATVDFSSAEVEGAVGCLVLFDAVADELGNAAPESSVGFQATQTTATTSSPTGGGGDSTANTTLSMKYSKKRGAFSGAASSPQAGCLSGRKVTVKKTKSGFTKKVGSATTNEAGRFRVPARRAKGKFFASIAPKQVTVGDGTVRCKGAKSPTVRVGRR